MNKKERFVITISRELGSGGRTIGEKLAKSLQVSFYDKAIVKALTNEYNLSVEEIEKKKLQREFWWTDFQNAFIPFYGVTMAQYYQPYVCGNPEILTTIDQFHTESKILTEISKKESCVVAGRSGFYVFRNHPNHLNILIQSPMENRIQRVMGKNNVSREQAIKDIKRVDKWRENYTKRYTDSSRHDSRNFDLVISMANLSEDDAVKLILDYIEKTNHQSIIN